jgi:transcriptional regulator GlxA family with amidase domain
LEVSLAKATHNSTDRDTVRTKHPVRKKHIPKREPLEEFGERVRAVLNLLKTRNGNLESKEMAKIIGRSERRAREIFHQITGESFRMAGLRARLAPAQFLVQGTTTPISEIAELVGYSKRSKFDQSYSKMFGVTPIRDRKDSAKKSSLQPVRGSTTRLGGV